MANAVSSFPALVTGVTVETATNGGLSGDGSSGNKLSVDTSVIPAPGSTTQVMFNDGGLLAGDAGLTYNKTTDELTLAGSVFGPTYIPDYLSILAPADDGIYIAASADGAGGGVDFGVGVSGKARLYYYDGTAFGTFDVNGTSAIASGGMEVHGTIANTWQGTASKIGLVVGSPSYSGETGDVQGIVAGFTSASTVGSSVGISATTYFTGTNGPAYGMAFAPHVLSGTIHSVHGVSGANYIASGATVTEHSTLAYLISDIRGTAVVPTLNGVYVDFQIPSGSPTITDAFQYYGKSLIGKAVNPYFLWYDGGGGDCNAGGVYRVNQFGISAYYNPCFAAYTPGSGDVERIISRWGDTGVFGTDNIAYFGVEATGTGTNRALELIGGGLRFNSTLVAPASSGTRYLCISTAGVVTSSATACSGT